MLLADRVCFPFTADKIFEKKVAFFTQKLAFLFEKIALWVYILLMYNYR